MLNLRFLCLAGFIILALGSRVHAADNTDYACKTNADDEIVVLGTKTSLTVSTVRTDDEGDQFNEIVEDTQGNKGDSCKETPNFYKIKFYRLGLCTSNPYTANDFSSCSFMVESDATNGVTHILTYPATGFLATNSVIEEGNYNFLVLVVSNYLEQKHYETFSTALYGYGGGFGKVCWTYASNTSYGGSNISGVTITAGSPSDSGSAIRCGNTLDVSTYDYTTEIFETLGGGFDADAQFGDTYVKLLKSDNATTASSVNDAKRMMIVIPKVATVEDDSKFELSFKLNRSTSFDFSWDSGSSKLYATKVGADPFQVTLTVN